MIIGAIPVMLGAANPAYWRIRATSQTHVSGTARSFRCAEIQFRTSISGADEAVGGTASASSGANPSGAFDDVVTTQWVAAVTTIGEWIAYSFPEGKSIKEVVISVATYFGVVVQAPDFSVDSSFDGTTWVSVATFSPGNTWVSDGSGYASLPLTFTLP